MKKLVSLFVAIALIASVFSVSSVAFADDSAEETATNTIEFVQSEFDKLSASNPKISLALDSDFDLEENLYTDWLKDPDTVAKVFSGINYVLDDSREATFTDEDKIVSSIVLENGELTIIVTVDETTKTVKLSNGDYDSAAENPLVGTWTATEGTVVFAADGTATVNFSFGGEEGEEALSVLASLTDVALGDSDNDGYDLASDSDTVKLQYLVPDKDYKDDDKWTNATLGSTLSVGTAGEWGFRYVAYANGSDEIAAKSNTIYITFKDQTAPVYNGLSSSMEKTQSDGVKVGSTYTIKTDLSVTEDSDKTITYKVYKKVNGSWTTDPIYDSATKTVDEDYADYISTSGVITFVESDILADNEPIYKIVYTITDEMGYVTTTDSDGEEIVMTIFAIEADAEETDATQIIKIVLYCVAGASLIGIIVVLCVKPKKSDENTTARTDEKQ